MKKILVAIDGSDLSKKAAEQAVILARAFNNDITFLTVVEIKPEMNFAYYDAGISPVYFTIRDNLQELDVQRSQSTLDAMVDALASSDINTKKMVLVGDPHPLIVQEAEDGNYDLIVMGHRGLNPLKRLFLGSVAKKVIEDISCSVLIIK